MLSKSRERYYFTRRVIIVKEQKLCKDRMAGGMGGEMKRNQEKKGKIENQEKNKILNFKKQKKEE